ncbi:MAG: hypothetical protein ISS57_11500 [Anaerolineales bacterium]|nr:hypothetical protein [Anaerolineales bacterium]
MSVAELMDGLAVKLEGGMLASTSSIHCRSLLNHANPCAGDQPVISPAQSKIAW